MNERVLCVDDDPNVLAAYQRNLRSRFKLETCLAGEEALRLVARQGPYAVVVADMRMPGMDGVHLLERLQQEAPDTVRIMLTGNADQQTAVDAVNRGHIFQFLGKPCPPETLAQVLSAGIRQYQLVTAERELLEGTLRGSVKVLGEILALQAPATFGRCQVVSDFVRTLLAAFVAGPAWQLEVAARVYRIGLVTIPPLVLQKTQTGEALAPRERDLLARVPELGAELLAQIPRLEPVAEIVRYQDKHFDGFGFPSDAVAGVEIPIGARVLKTLTDLADLQSQGLSMEIAFHRLRKRTGVYDPQVLAAAGKCFGVDLPRLDSREAVCRSVKVDELRIGQVLMSKVETLDGLMITIAGNEISPLVLQIIQNFAALSGVKEPILVRD